MNQEELQTCRDLLAMLQDENGEVAEYWGKMLAHIDAQAAQIEAMKEEADCSDIVGALEGAGIDMGEGEQCQDIITAIEILGSRIEALKEKLLAERVAYLRAVKSYHAKNGLEYVAKEQLKAEMPGVEWE